MNRILLMLVPVFLIAACNNSKDDSNVQENAGRYSNEIYQAIDATLDEYYKLSELLVNWDSTRVNNAVTELGNKMNDLKSRLDTTQNQKDLAAGEPFLDKASEASGQMLNDADLFAKRHNFHKVSENLFHFLEAIRYDRHPVYLQECTMPFNDTGRGVWLSKTEDRRNPYLGMYHPYYKSGMLECGSLEEKIDFTTKTN